MRLAAVLLLVVVQAGPARPADSPVAAIVAGMLASAEHPGLKWRAIPDVVAALRPLYDAEPDRLVWIDGTTPSASLDATLAALRSAGDHGLDPADYERTVKVLLGGGSDPVITKEPTGAWTHAVWDAMKQQ